MMQEWADCLDRLKAGNEIDANAPASFQNSTGAMNASQVDPNW